MDFVRNTQDFLLDSKFVHDGVTIRVLCFFYIPAQGIAQALQPVIGINYGAGKNGRVITGFHIFTIYSTLLCCLLWSFIALFPGEVLAIFNVHQVKPYWNWFFLSVPFMGCLLNLLTMLQFIKRVKLAFLLLLMRMIVFFLPLLYLMAFYFQIEGIWLSVAVTDFFVLFSCSFAYSHIIKELKARDYSSVEFIIYPQH